MAVVIPQLLSVENFAVTSRRSRWPETLLAARGSRSLDHVGFTGGVRAHDTSSGPLQRDSPAAQGGIQILGKVDVVYIPVTMLHKSKQIRVSGASSTECGTLQSCHRDRYALQIWVWLLTRPFLYNGAVVPTFLIQAAINSSSS